MWDKFRSLSSGPKLWTDRSRSTQGRRGRRIEAQGHETRRIRHQRGGVPQWANIWNVKANLMLEKAQRLLQPSARSAVPPFMVMDVMAAAARLEAQGRRIVHMEVGQPAAGAPASAIAAARAALVERPARLYRDARHCLAAAAHRARLCRMAWSRHRPGAHRRHHRLLGRLHAGVSRRLRSRGSRGGGAAGLSALSPYPQRARLRAGRGSRPMRRDAMVDHQRSRCSRSTARGRSRV